MPQEAWSPKRERQYEHIKDGAQGAGRAGAKRAKEIAARTVNKERARTRRGEGVESRTSTDGHVVQPARRAALARRAKGRTKEQLYNEAKPHEHQGPVEDEQGAARARRRSEEELSAAAGILAV